MSTSPYFRFACGLTFAVALAACSGVAWAADEQVTVVSPAPSSDAPVVVTEPAPGTKVTVIERSDAGTRIRHEALVDTTSKTTTVIAPVEPPAPKEEVIRIESRPAADFVWVPGYWRWDTERSTYEWVPGAWRRQVPDMVWHSGHWEKSDEGYVWVSGYWGERKTGDADVVVIKQAPPALRVEERTESPGADYQWISGHWRYENGTYTWVSGRWERPAGEGMIYIPGEWAKRGDGYVYIAGHWDYPEENRSSVARREGGDLERQRFQDDERSSSSDHR